MKARLYLAAILRDGRLRSLVRMRSGVWDRLGMRSEGAAAMIKNSSVMSQHPAANVTTPPQFHPIAAL